MNLRHCKEVTYFNHFRQTQFTEKINYILIYKPIIPKLYFILNVFFNADAYLTLNLNLINVISNCFYRLWTSSIN